MAGIVRIHIVSNWKEPRLAMSRDLELAANDLHRETFASLNMPLKDQGVEIVECTKEQAMARYDWQEGIDCILYFANGHKATMQEKYLDWVHNTITFTEHQKNKVPGNWYTSTAQYWFTGYARKYKTEHLLEFDNWIYVDLPLLHRLDATAKLAWQFNDNKKTGYEGIAFRFLNFEDMPVECLVKRRSPTTGSSNNQFSCAQDSYIHWPAFPPPDDHPTWPREQYEDWIKRKAGTPEQLSRYAQAIAWYRAHL